MMFHFVRLLLFAGVLTGLVLGFCEVHDGHRGRRADFENHIAEICTAAALRNSKTLDPKQADGAH